MDSQQQWFEKTHYSNFLSKKRRPNYVVKTFANHSQLEESKNDLPHDYENSKEGSVLKVEEFSRHIVASKEVTNDLMNINTIEDIDQVWNSLRIGSLNRQEAEKIGLIQAPHKPPALKTEKATLPVGLNQSRDTEVKTQFEGYDQNPLDEMDLVQKLGQPVFEKPSNLKKNVETNPLRKSTRGVPPHLSSYQQHTNSSVLAADSPTGTIEIKHLNQRLQQQLREISVVDMLSVPGRDANAARRRNSEVMTDIQYTDDSPIRTRKKQVSFPRMPNVDIMQASKDLTQVVKEAEDKLARVEKARQLAKQMEQKRQMSQDR